jgi:hypothetical protein
MITEIVNDLADLEIGDVVIYSSGVGMRSAKIERKPVKTSPTSTYHKATRCKVNATVRTFPKKVWRNGAYVVEGTHSFKTQHFNLEEFNEVKYLNFSAPILRVIEV